MRKGQKVSEHRQPLGVKCVEGPTLGRPVVNKRGSWPMLCHAWQGPGGFEWESDLRLHED